MVGWAIIRSAISLPTTNRILERSRAPIFCFAKFLEFCFAVHHLNGAAATG